MSQTPAQMLRDIQARGLAIRRYAAAYDRFAEQVQLLVGAEREGAARFAEWVFRAWQADLNDPAPRGPCECEVCMKLVKKQ